MADIDLDVDDTVSIPVIDFSVYSLKRGQTPTAHELETVVGQVGDSLTNYRCFRIINSGIDHAQVGINVIVALLSVCLYKDTWIQGIM